MVLSAIESRAAAETHLRGAFAMTPDADAVLARAFPDGVPAAEAALLASLPPARSDAVLRRLESVLLANDKMRPPLAELARRAGVARSVFFDLRRRWNSERTLAALTPFANTTARGAVDRGGSKAAMPAVRRLVAKTPDFVSAGEVARQVMRETKEDLDFRTALRLVRRERQLSSTTPTYLRRNFGRVVLLDICAVDVPLTGDLQAAVSAIVLERASLLVLGAATGPRGDMAALQLRAVDRALWFLGREAADRVLQRDEITVELVAPDDKADAVRLLDPIYGRSGFDVTATGERRFGRRASAILGGRIRGLHLMPGHTLVVKEPSPRLSKRSPVDPYFADEFVERSVWEHNLPRLKALRAAAGEELAFTDDGVMSAALRQVREALVS